MKVPTDDQKVMLVTRKLFFFNFKRAKQSQMNRLNWNVPGAYPYVRTCTCAYCAYPRAYAHTHMRTVYTHVRIVHTHVHFF